MMGQPIVTYRAVIALHIGVLLPLSRLDEINADATLCGPRQGHRADVLGTVIAANDQWLAAPFDNPVERSDHPLGRQREVDLDAESFAVVVVDHIEQTDAAAIGELVVHEVHRPGLVDLRGYGQRQRLFPHQTMPWLDPQVQFQFAVNPVNAFVVPVERLHVAQV